MNDEAGTSAGEEGWNAGVSSAERNGWISLSPSGNSRESSSANPIHSNVNGANKEDSSWERNMALNNNQSWGVAVAENRVQGSSWVGKVGGDFTSSDTWHEASETGSLSRGVAAAVDSNDHSTGWGDKAGCDSPVSDNWKKASEAASNLSWGVAAAVADNNHGFVWVGNDSQRPSVADGADIVSAWNKPDKGSWRNKTGGSSWGNQADWSIKEGSSTADLGWKSSRLFVENQTGSWGDAGFYGTTTAAIIGNDAAYLVFESRAMSAKANEKGLILDGKHKKTFKLGPSILAIGAGNSEELDQMKAAAKKAVKNGGVQKVCKVLEKFISEWKRNNKGKSFPTILTLVWSTKYMVAIRLFDGKNKHTITENDVLVSTGKGSGFLKEYVTECLKKKKLISLKEYMTECLKKEKLISDDDYMGCLVEGLVYSCTRSKSSGGIIRGGLIPKGEEAKRWDGNHVLVSLSLCEDLVEGYLNSSIFCTSSVLDYNLNTEIDLEGQVSEKLGSPHKIQVLGVRKNL